MTGRPEAGGVDDDREPADRCQRLHRIQEIAHDAAQRWRRAAPGDAAAEPLYDERGLPF